MRLLVFLFTGCVLALLWTGWAIVRAVRKHGAARSSKTDLNRTDPDLTDPDLADPDLTDPDLTDPDAPESKRHENKPEEP
jgi:hypothetical protein